jgi:hypothetical protein
MNHMKKIIGFLLFAFSLAISHSASAQLFSESHKISFPLNGSEQFGAIQSVQYGDGSWSVIGGLTAKSGNDYLRIMGTLAQYEPNILRFTGTVFVKSSDLLGFPCVNTGDFQFIKARGQKYWRSKESFSCDQKMLYLNIHF